MAVRQIRIWPDPALSEVARPVDNVDDSIRTLITDLFDTMYDSNGVGLAATQVAVAKRVLVIDLDPKRQAKRDPEVKAELDSWSYAGPVAFINPEIIESSGEIVWDEGCLSVPGIVENVKRKEHVVVRALDKNGETFITKASGLFAVCLQHEMDHLNGRVFVEYLSKLKRDVIKRKMVRLKSQAEERPLAAGGSR